MTKVVYNACYGGFSLSHEGMLHYCKLAGIEVEPEETRYGFWAYRRKDREVPKPIADGKWLELSLEQRSARNRLLEAAYISERDFVRHDRYLVQTVEELGAAADGCSANLAIAEVTEGKYYIDEDDGMETVVQPSDVRWIEV